MFRVYKSEKEIICISCNIDGKVDTEEYDAFFKNTNRDIKIYDQYIAKSIKIETQLKSRTY